jgi:hypothetical protein
MRRARQMTAALILVYVVLVLFYVADNQFWILSDENAGNLRPRP